MTFVYDLRKLRTKEHLLNYFSLDEYWFDSAISFDAKIHRQQFQASAQDSELFAGGFAFLMHEIPKRNPKRGCRIVWEPFSAFKNAYKALARRLTAFFEHVIPGFPHPSCYGYVRGRNIRENAGAHLGANKILKVDLKEFFPSIPGARICSFLCNLGVRDEIASLVEKFLTIDGALALGLPTSPIVANAICHEMDIDMEALASSIGCKYSRYADDLTFSSNDLLPDVSDVQRIVEAHCFELEHSKTRFIKRGQNFYVTGLSISDAKVTHAPRKMKRDLRQQLFFAKKHGLDGHLERIGRNDSQIKQNYINYLDGRVKYIAFHEPHLATEIVPLWQCIFEESGDKSSFEPKNQHTTGFAFYVDETEFLLNGQKYLALGLSASQHQNQINETTARIWEGYLANPLADGRPEKILQNGLHFYDASEDLKKEYIEALNKLPFSAYVLFGQISNPDEYEAQYLRLLGSIIRRRLMAAESMSAHFNFESTDKVSQVAIKDLVEGEWGKLRASNNRHPLHIDIRFVGKESVGVSVPDFILGVFRKYIESGPATNPPRREHVLFEYLRDKIRVIMNVDTGEEFTRRNPLQK